MRQYGNVIISVSDAFSPHVKPLPVHSALDTPQNVTRTKNGPPYKTQTCVKWISSSACLPHLPRTSPSDLAEATESATLSQSPSPLLTPTLPTQPRTRCCPGQGPAPRPRLYLASNVGRLIAHSHPGDAREVYQGQIRDVRGADLQVDQLMTDPQSFPSNGILG